jgi:hypothetical protein
MQGRRVGEWANGRVGVSASCSCSRLRWQQSCRPQRAKATSGRLCSWGVCRFRGAQRVEGSCFAGWQIWWFAATERLPREDRRLPRTSRLSAIIPAKWNGARGRPADRAKYSMNGSREPLAANLLICYLIKRFPPAGFELKTSVGIYHHPPFF